MNQLDPQFEGVDPTAAQPRWPDDPQSRRQRLEAVLLMSRSPLPSRKLSQLADLEDGTQARTMVRELNQHYDKVGRAFHIKHVAGGYQLRTRPQFADWIGQLEYLPARRRISQPALETLTVIAYRQPIIKADIEAIRGVSCGEMLRQLLEKGLVKIAGRSEKLGRPFLYATTKDFLTHFGFNSLSELPRANQLSGEGLPEWATSENDTRSDSETVDPAEVEPAEKPNTQMIQEPSPLKEEEE